MENLNAEQAIEEIDSKIKFAKFANTDAVILSSKAAQFCLVHAQYYEQKIKELTEENERLQKHNAVLIEDNHILSSECIPMAKADTVRKMQERLTSFFANDDNLKYIEVDAEYINQVIDQVAKEITDETSE